VGSVPFIYRAFFCLLCSEGFNHLIQAALVSRGLVLIDNALVNHRIYDRHGGVVGRCRHLLVAFLDGLNHVLDMGSHFGAKPHFVKSGLLRLTGAFPG